MTDDHTHRGDDVHSVEAAMREANGGEVERLRSLLGRYADHVGDEEGTDFLGHVVIDGFSPITQAEALEIRSYCPSNKPTPKKGE
jgi:hypothetical protein